MVGTIILEAALSSGKKSAAKFGSKLVTTVAAAMANKATCDQIHKLEPDMTQVPEEKRDREGMKRTIRDASVAAGFTCIGVAIHSCLSAVIDASDISI